MTEMRLTKNVDGSWRPADEVSWDRARKFPAGVSCFADIKNPSRRSGAQHNMFFALVSELFKNQEKHTNFDHFRALLLIHLGYCEIYPQPDGSMVPIAKSLQFGKMPPEEFSALVDATLNFAESLGWDRSELEAQIVSRAA